MHTPSAVDKPGNIFLIKAIFCLSAGAFLTLAFSPFDYYLISILSICVLFLVWLDATQGQALVYGYLYGLGMFGTGVSWIHVSINLFGGINLVGASLLTLLFVAYLALYPAAVGFLHARYFKTGYVTALILILPALWTLSEWCREWIFTGFPWLNLGNSQIDTVFAGLAPMAGVYGISFAVCACAGCLVCLAKCGMKGRVITVISLSLFCLACQLLLQLPWTHRNAGSISVALVQGAIPQQIKWSPEQREQTFERYLGLTEAYWGSDIIVWPETAIPVFYQQAKSFIDSLDAVAEKHDTALLTGIPYRDDDSKKFFNSILLLGKSEGIYHKHHLVPFGEYMPFNKYLRPFLYFLRIPMSEFSSGTGDPQPLDVKKASIGMSVCYEDAFGKEVIKTLPGANLLLNVSNDAWFGDSLAPHQHLQIARMRALETGRYLLRSTNTGISAVIDEKGQVVARSPQFTATVLTADVYTYQGATPYVLTGNRVIVTICLMILLIAILSQRRRRPAAG